MKIALDKSCTGLISHVLHIQPNDLDNSVGNSRDNCTFDPAKSVVWRDLTCLINSWID